MEVNMNFIERVVVKNDPSKVKGVTINQDGTNPMMTKSDEWNVQNQKVFVKQEEMF